MSGELEKDCLGASEGGGSASQEGGKTPGRFHGAAPLQKISGAYSGHNGVSGWIDTGSALVGVPAVFQNTVHTVDGFFRDPGNRLLHIFHSSGKWFVQPMNGVVITDPVAVSWGVNRFDVIALGGDYKLYHWWWTGGAVQRELVSNNALGLGTPALVTSGANHLDIFFRGWDRTLYHLRSTTGIAPWTLEMVGGTLLDFPSALATGGGTLRACIRDASSQLWEAVQVNGGAWQWASLSAASGSLGTPIAGSPSASLKNGTVTMYARTAAGNLATFTFLAGKWAFASHGGNVSGSPTAIPGGALIRGQSGALFLFDGVSWVPRGGIFD